MYEKLPFDITVHYVYTGNTTGCRQTSLSQVRSNSSAAAQYKLFFFFTWTLGRAKCSSLAKLHKRNDVSIHERQVMHICKHEGRCTSALRHYIVFVSASFGMLNTEWKEGSSCSKALVSRLKGNKQVCLASQWIGKRQKISVSQYKFH